MTVYNFTQVLVVDNQGGSVRLAKQQRLAVTDPTTGSPAPSLTQGGTAVLELVSDSTGHVDFTSTLPTVRLTSQSGFWQDVTSQDAIEASAAVNLGVDLTDQDSVDVLKKSGTNRVPSPAVGTAVGLPTPGPGAVRVDDSGYSGINKIVEQYSWDYLRASFLRRTSQTTGSWTPWWEFRPADSGMQRRVHARSGFLARRGGTIGTGGRAAVALRFDHHTAAFASKVLPLLQQYGVPWSLAMNPNTIGSGDDTMTYAQMQDACIGYGGEIWNHGGDHNDRSNDQGIRAQTIDSLATLRAGFPRLPVEGWNMPGVGGTGYNGLSAGATEDQWATYAGSLVLQHHAVVSGATGGVYRPLMGQIGVGQGHYTMDAQSDTTVKGVIDGAVKAGGGLVLLLHPSALDAASSMTTAQFESVLAYIASLRDAGTLMCLSQTGLMIADRSKDERHNLLPGLLTGAHGWTGWTVTSGVATGSSTPLTRNLDLARQMHMAGSTRELVVYAKASAARTVTITTTDTNGTVATTHALPGTGVWVRLSRPYTIPLDSTGPTIAITSSGTTDIVRIDALAI